MRRDVMQEIKRWSVPPEPSSDDERRLRFSKLQNIGLKAIEAEHPSLALEVFKESYKLLKPRMDLWTEQSVDYYTALGGTYARLGMDEEAISCFKSGLAIAEKAYGADAVATVPSILNNASLMLDCDQVDGARFLLSRATEVCASAPGTDGTDALRGLWDVSELYMRIDDADSALKALETRKALCMRVFGTMHEFAVLMEHDLGSFYVSTGQGGQAVKHFQEALDLGKHILGAAHPDLVKTWVNLSHAYEQTGDETSRRTAMEQAVRISERTPGLESPETAMRWSNLALVYMEQGDLQRADDYSAKSMQIADSPEGAVSGISHYMLSARANVLLEMKRPDEAIELVKRAVAVLRTYGESARVDLCRTLVSVSDLTEQSGQFEAALQYAREAYGISIAEPSFDDGERSEFQRHVQALERAVARLY